MAERGNKKVGFLRQVPPWTLLLPDECGTELDKDERTYPCPKVGWTMIEGLGAFPEIDWNQDRELSKAGCINTIFLQSCLVPHAETNVEY